MGKGSAAKTKIEGLHSQILEEVETPPTSCSLGGMGYARPGAEENGGGMRQGADANDDAAGMHELRQLAGGYGKEKEAPDDRTQAW